MAPLLGVAVQAAGLPGSSLKKYRAHQDDDGVAYIAYSSEDNRVMHIGPLTRDFTGVQARRAGMLTAKC